MRERKEKQSKKISLRKQKEKRERGERKYR